MPLYLSRLRGEVGSPTGPAFGRPDDRLRDPGEGPFRESERVNRPPHPDPLPASGAREQRRRARRPAGPTAPAASPPQSAPAKIRRTPFEPAGGRLRLPRDSSMMGVPNVLQKPRFSGVCRGRRRYPGRPDPACLRRRALEPPDGAGAHRGPGSRCPATCRAGTTPTVPACPGPLPAETKFGFV
jgi:hypothetical protein